MKPVGALRPPGAGWGGLVAPNSNRKALARPFARLLRDGATPTLTAPHKGGGNAPQSSTHANINASCSRASVTRARAPVMSALAKFGAIPNEIALVGFGVSIRRRRLCQVGPQPRSGDPRLYDPPPWRRSPIGPAWRRQYFGQDNRQGGRRRRGQSPLRQGQRLGHGRDRAARPARGQALRTRRARRLRRALGRGDGAPAAPAAHGSWRAQPVRRGDPACADPGQARRSHPCQRHRGPDQSVRTARPWSPRFSPTASSFLM